MSYWKIEGMGFDMSDLKPFLDAEKVKSALLTLEKPPFDAADAQELFQGLSNHDALELLEDFFDDNDSYAGFFARSESTNVLVSANDGESGHYLLYEPKYPWDVTRYDCFSAQEARDHIVDVVMPFVLEGTARADLLALLDFFDEVGAG